MRERGLDLLPQPSQASPRETTAGDRLLFSFPSLLTLKHWHHHHHYHHNTGTTTITNRRSTQLKQRKTWYTHRLEDGPASHRDIESGRHRFAVDSPQKCSSQSCTQCCHHHHHAKPTTTTHAQRPFSTLRVPAREVTAVVHGAFLSLPLVISLVRRQTAAALREALDPHKPQTKDAASSVTTSCAIRSMRRPRAPCLFMRQCQHASL